MADIVLNGLNASSLNFWVDNTDDVRHTAGATYDVVNVPWRHGGLVSARPTVKGRPLTLRGRILTSANTATARVAAEHLLRDWLLNTGLVGIGFDDGIAPLLQIDGYCDQLTLTPVGHPLTAVASTVTARFTCPDPLWRAAAGTIVAVAATATRYSLPLGSAPSAPIVRIMGSATNPVLTLRDHGGTAQVTLTFTVSLTSSEYLDVDCERGVITKVSSGTATSGISLLTSGTFPFAIDPSWGSVANSTWPKIEISAGSAEVLYAKRWY